MSAAELAPEDLAMLRFAGEWWRDPAAREQAIRDRFGLPPVRFYQRIAYLITTPAALAAEPLVVARLKRLAQARSRLRVRSSAAGVYR